MIGWLLGLNSSEAERRPRLLRRASRGRRAGWSRREVLTLRRRKPKPDGTWRVEIKPGGCSDCQACIRICEREALRRCREADSVVYSLAADRCNGCGDCREVCAGRALNVARSDEAADVIEAGRLAIEGCSSCGRRGVGNVAGLYLVCRHEELRLGIQGRRLR